MHYSENIGKIKRFFTKEKNSNRAAFIVDLDKSLRCKVLALLLLNSELATPKLNRDNVYSLLTGKLAWPKNDGSMYFVGTSVELELLEELGAITFYAGYCEIHSRSISNCDSISESVRPIYDALELLKNILYGNEFISPHFYINKQSANELMKEHSLFINLDGFQGVLSDGDNYRIELDDYRHDCLLPEFLWKEVIASLDINIESLETNCSEINLNKAQKDKLSKWLLICRVYPDNYLTSIDFNYFDREEKVIFLDFFESVIVNDPQLKKSRCVLKNKWLCNSNFNELFFEIDQTIQIEISSSGETSVKDTQKLPVPLSIDEVKSKFVIPEPVVDGSCLAFVKYWEEYARSINSDNRFYSSLLMQFIESDIFINNSSINSYGRLNKFLDESLEREELRYILLCELAGYSGIEYLLYLLTNKCTATTAVYLFANKALYSLVGLSVSEYDSYHFKYFPAVCDEFLDLSFKNKFNNISEKNIVELLIILADDSIYTSYYGELNSKKDCLDILLKRFSTEQVSYFSESLFSELEKGVVETDRNFSIAKLYLLFWLLEKSQDFNLPNRSDLSSKIQLLISKMYLVAFKENTDNKDNKLDAYKLFDYLPWWRIDDEYIVDYLQIIKNPANWALKLSNSNSCQYQNKKLARSYLQLLIGLKSEKRSKYNNDLITLKILGLIESCGFSGDNSEFCGLFDYELRGDYSLWQQFISSVDEMSDESFDRVLSILASGTPINLVLELYEKVNKESRKAKVLEHIKSPSEETIDSLGIATLEKSLDLACRAGQVDIAKIMLDKGLLILSNENSYLRKRLPSREISILEDKWCSYEFKINLLMIFNDDSLSNEEKLDRIREYKKPFSNEKHYQQRSNLARSCNQFQRTVIALILHETNPEVAYKYFHALYLEDENIYYSGNRFASKLAYLDRSKSSDNIDYKTALNEWLSSIDDFDIQSMNFKFVTNWFSCLMKNNDLRGVDALWNKLSEAQRNCVSIVTYYCQSLKQRGEHHSANLIYNNLKKYHNVTSLGDEAEKQWQELSEMVVNDNEPVVIAALSKVLAEKPKSINELRQGYREICSKKLDEAISIIDGVNSTVESFLYENIYSIIGELQLRKNNLNKSDRSDNATSYRITKEDLINDWLTSLFDHRLSYLGLSCRDQKRGGQASSTQNPGEIDFFLCGHNNERIAIMEAFRIFSNDKTVINNHLNKVAGYDQQCLSPVFIIAYCDVSDFSTLCHNYSHDSLQREYKGFRKSSLKEDEFVNLEDSSTVKTYKETRYRDQKPITVYHFLVNLRFNL